MSVKPKVKIDIHEWVNSCGDDCCIDFGIAITVNGKRLLGDDGDYETILTKVLEHLGYEVELNLKIDECY